MQRSLFRPLGATVLAGALSLSISSSATAQDKVEEETVVHESDVAEDEGSWTDMISAGAFVDANVAVTSQRSGTSVPGAVVDGAGNHRAYVMNNGFNLNFAGLDLAMAGEQWGGTISMRFGPGVIGFFGDQGAFGISNITQAYATWMPHEKITFDLGQFGTIYGAEVAESWQNMNYTRGALYWAMQPFWHTGLRAGFSLTDNLGLTVLVANGTNNIYEYGKGPSLGLQVAIEYDAFSAYIGWYGDTDPKTDANDPIGAGGLYDHFFDLTASAGVGDFSLVLNADVGFAGEDTGDFLYYGVSVAPGYAFTDWFGAAARVEYLGYPDNTDTPSAFDAMGDIVAGQYESLVTITGTLDIKPVPNSGNLILRPEFRYELASDDVYVNRDLDGFESGWWVLTLGAVVTTDG